MTRPGPRMNPARVQPWVHVVAITSLTTAVVSDRGVPPSLHVKLLIELNACRRIVSHIRYTAPAILTVCRAGTYYADYRFAAFVSIE